MVFELLYVRTSALGRGDRMSKLLVAFLATAALWAVPGALATHGGSTEVTVGSPDTPFTQNKQNEPSVAINPIAPNIVAAGANDEIDLEGCNVAADNTCPFTTGVGTSGISFSTTSGDSWVQPTYTGWTARHCLGVAGTSTDTCAAHLGAIGTLPRYYENGLVSDGDPAVAFGPKPGPNGTFSWSNGWRLYYANLTANFSAQRSDAQFKGFEAIAVSRLDDANFARALAGDSTAWHDPVVVSKQNSALFSDHEQVAVDDAASSPFFGNVYICDAAFRGQEKGNAAPDPIVLNSSSDGGQTWGQTQLSAATNNGQGLGRQDCQVNTDSRGTVYVFWQGGDPQTRQNTIFMARSSDGGKHFERPPAAVATFDGCGLVDAAGELAFDGVAGARDGSFPSIDIANGAPTGANAPDTIVMTWCDGPTPTNTSPGPNEQAIVQYSTNRGTTWTRIGNGAEAGDRPDFPAVAISPDGRDVYLVYMAFLQPWQTTTASPRPMQGVVRHADFAGVGTSFTTLHRGVVGDARGSSANSLTGEFLGDYNYAFATNAYAVATWNDVRNAADCPAVDAYRQSLMTETTADDLPAPAPATQCPPLFGNSDIFGGSYADPSSP
jgi:hypothetical protein